MSRSGRRGIAGAVPDASGIAVRCGGLLLADRNGVAAVPAARAGEVITAAEAITVREAAVAGHVRAVQSVVDVMHDSRFTAGGARAGDRRD